MSTTTTADELTIEQIEQVASVAGRDIDLAMSCSEAKFRIDTDYPAHRQYARERVARVWNRRFGS